MAEETLRQTQLSNPEEGLALAPSGWHPVRASFEVDKVNIGVVVAWNESKISFTGFCHGGVVEDTRQWYEHRSFVVYRPTKYTCGAFGDYRLSFPHAASLLHWGTSGLHDFIRHL